MKCMDLGEKLRQKTGEKLLAKEKEAPKKLPDSEDPERYLLLFSCNYQNTERI